jgi:type I restriction enzyme S subunit
MAARGFALTPLGEVVSFANGKSIKPGGEGAFPVYGSNGIIGYNDATRFQNAIIIGRVGAYCGSIAYCQGKFWASDNTIVAQSMDQQHDIRFLNYLLLHMNLNRWAGGAAQPLLTQTVLKGVESPIPLPEIQHKIATILSTYDDLIENNLRRIKILEEMAQAIYREWFVKFRFPGHEKIRMVDSPLGKIPQGWEVANLSDLVDTQYGYTESATVEKVGPKFLRGTDINKTSFVDWSQVPHCPIPENKLSKYKLGIGDIVIIRMADPGKVGIVEKEIDAVFASYLVRLEIISNILSPYFLFYFLTSDRYQGYITGASTGTTRKSASAGVITDIDLPIPPLSLRKQFEDQVTAIRQFLNKLLEKNTTLRHTLDLLLPKLISGELDVSDLDIKTGGYMQ